MAIVIAEAATVAEYVVSAIAAVTLLAIQKIPEPADKIYLLHLIFCLRLWPYLSNL